MTTEEEAVRSVVTLCRVKRSGNSLVAVLTKEVKLMGIKEGDVIKVTVSRM